jgi:DNA repair exonuclease SbcCD ATPase subunit
MGIENISNQIATLDHEINNLEREIQNLDTDITRKSKDAATITEKISREKDLKRLAALSKDLAGKNNEINNLEKRKTPKTKSLTDKQKKKRDLLVLLNKEEKKERDKSKNEQKEILNIQKQITREIESRQRMALQSLDKFIPLNTDEKTAKQYDVFISHASEDKDDFVRPFAALLREKELKVWYNEFELKIGDKLRRKIDEGLSKTRYGVVVLSNFFFAKEWPQKELDGLFAIFLPLKIMDKMLFSQYGIKSVKMKS